MHTSNAKTLPILVSFLFLLSAPGFSQDKFTISGYLKNATSGETLIGASVYVPTLQTGATSNVYGFYSLSLPAGSYTLKYSYVGHKPVEKQLDLRENTAINIELSPIEELLEEVVVRAEAENANIKKLEMSTQKLDMQTVQKMPALLGEVDILRSIQQLPGVSTVGEGAAGFNVRGGSIDQNLVILDEAPVYNSSHLLGFFSVFNPDAVKDVKLYKGGIPAQYGGRLSSILDVRMKEGNRKKLSASGGVGLIFSRLTIEAPIVKDKASFILAGRRSYFDVVARPFLREELRNSAFNFYDLTLKTNVVLNPRNQLFLSGYLGRDVFKFGENGGFNWGNQTLSFRWNHLFNSRLFSNITAFYSKYDYKLGFRDKEDNDSFDWTSHITNYSIRPELNYFVNPKNTLTFGGQALLYGFSPGSASGVSAGERLDFSLSKKRALETSVFIGNEQTVSPKLSLQYGLRYTLFAFLGKGTAYEYHPAEAPGERRFVKNGTDYKDWEVIKTYQNLEPRFSLKYELNNRSSLKASYQRMSQYLHLISNGAASIPLDVWTPSTNNIRPQLADQIALGYFRNFAQNTYETSAEVYYKKFDHLVEYVDGANLMLNEFLEGDLLAGIGRAYGLELLVEKKKGRFTGWIAYTLARTERKIEGINNNKWFPARFDQTHNLGLTTFYEANSRVTLSGTFTLISGTPSTFPTNRIEQQGYLIPHNAEGSRNNYRIPAYHRLDVALTLKRKPKVGMKNKSFWVFSVYNLYGRRNPFSIFFRQDKKRPQIGQPIRTEAVRYSIIGNLIPSVSYNFKF